MNKMTKGAIATAAGIVLLIGGGGTLAVWNVEQNSQAGTIQAGNLNLTTANGQWLVNGGVNAIDISTYKIVPGDSLTYTEDVTITVDGDNLTAELILSGMGGETDFVNGTYVTEGVELKDLEGQAILAGNIKDDVVGPKVIKGKASVNFVFNVGTTKRDSATATYSFAAAQFALKQVV